MPLNHHRPQHPSQTLLTTYTPNGPIDLTPWDPATHSPIRRPFAPFSSTHSTPTSPYSLTSSSSSSSSSPSSSSPYIFHTSRADRLRRDENDAWVAQQLEFYSAPGTPVAELSRRGRRHGRGRGRDATIASFTFAFGTHDLKEVLRIELGRAGLAATERIRKIRRRGTRALDAWRDWRYRSRGARREALAVLRAVLLIVAFMVALGFLALRVLGGEGDEQEAVREIVYVLVREPRAWSLCL